LAKKLKRRTVESKKGGGGMFANRGVEVNGNERGQLQSPTGRQPLQREERGLRWLSCRTREYGGGWCGMQGGPLAGPTTGLRVSRTGSGAASFVAGGDRQDWRTRRSTFATRLRGLRDGKGGRSVLYGCLYGFKSRRLVFLEVSTIQSKKSTHYRNSTCRT